MKEYPAFVTKVVVFIRLLLLAKTYLDILNSREITEHERKVTKGVWGMPRLLEAMKDVISCEKLRGLAHTI